MDFVKFEIKHFNLLDNAILRIFRDFCFPYRFWIKLNLNFNKTCNTTILETIAAKWNSKWSLEQIKWVEK